MAAVEPPMPGDRKARLTRVGLLYHRGYTDRQIADALGVSVSTIRRDRKRLGLQK